jgi:hypothetical protein
LDDRETLLELFKTYLDDLGRIGSRHENVRTFYVSVISALFVFLAMAGKDGPSELRSNMPTLRCSPRVSLTVSLRNPTCDEV